MDEKLPHQICMACFNRAKNCYEFILMCRKNDKHLRNNIPTIDNSNRIDITSIVQPVPIIKNNFSLIETRPIKDKYTKSEITSELESMNVQSDITVETKNGNIVHITSNQKEQEFMGDTKRKKKVKPTQCSICGKVVSSDFRLKCHMRIHSGEKPFKCSSCNKSFSLAYNLKVHARIHSGEKPLQCKICQKTFSQSAGLISHMRVHTGEKPYKCTICPMAFKSCSHLQYHIRLHTGEKKFACDVCERPFITKSDLTQHMKTHSGIRDFICSICGLGLSRNYHLTRHMLTHTGIKNFKCDYCENAYSQKSDLIRHIGKHTKDFKGATTIVFRVKNEENSTLETI